MWSFRFSDLAPRNLRRTWQEGGPVITAILVVLCVAVWLVELIGRWIAPGFGALFMLNGTFRPVFFRALPWTAVTSMFFHAIDPLHVISNMLCLIMVGPLLEHLYGHLTYLWIYLLSGLGGSLGLSAYSFCAYQAKGDYELAAFGASGAIFGLFGALLVVYRISRVSRNEMTSLIILLALNFALPIFDSTIAWQAHVGGFVIGLLYSLLLSRVVPRMGDRLRFEAKTSMWAVVFLILLIAGFYGFTQPFAAIALR